VVNDNCTYFHFCVDDGMEIKTVVLAGLVGCTHSKDQTKLQPDGTAAVPGSQRKPNDEGCWIAEWV
jgi:hypothetical protein